MEGPVQKIMIGAGTTLLTAAILAGASGLVTARTTKADVEKMQAAIEEQRRMTSEMQSGMAELRTNIKMMREEDKTLRKEYRDDQKSINEKLDRILQSH